MDIKRMKDRKHGTQLRQRTILLSHSMLIDPGRVKIVTPERALASAAWVKQQPCASLYAESARLLLASTTDVETSGRHIGRRL